MQINIDTSSLKALEARLNGMGKQVNYAASRAINSVAFDAMREGQAHIAAGLNNPTPWTIKAWYVRKKADKNSLVASVGWSDYMANKRGHAAEHYLVQHWNGGTRQLKAFEKRLQRAGLMPAGMMTAIGKAAFDLGMVDTRGNLKGSALVSILSGLGAFTEAGYSANASTARSKKLKGSKAAARHVYWAGKPGPNTPNGIWMIDEKHKSGRGRLRPILVYIKSANYKKRLDLDKTVEKSRAKFDQYFNVELQNALRTAR